MSYGDSDLDPFGPFSGDGPELELDLPAPASEPTGGHSTGRGSGKSHPELNAQAEAEKLPKRAAELAHHGDPPRIWLEVPYAIAVIRRVRALRKKLPMLARVRDATEIDLAASTMELGRALYAARGHARAQELGTPLRIAIARHRRANAGREEFETARQEAETSIEALEQTIAFERATGRPLRLRARELQAQIVVFQQDFEAVSKVIHDATTELAAIEKSKEPDANRRVELEAMRTNRRVEVTAALAEIESRTPELGEAEAKLRELDKSSAKAQAEIDEITAGLATIEARVDLEGADAQAAFESAIRDLADEGVRTRLDYKITPAEARRARLHFDTLVSHQRELDAHEMALTLSHRGAVQRGVGLLILGCLAIVAWLLHMMFS